MNTTLNNNQTTGLTSMNYSRSKAQSKKSFTLAEILITQNHKGEKSMVKERTASKGFTLAEILITLTVIGVVAALTIPTLLQNTQDAELKTAYKKSFGDFSQATIQIMNDNGGNLMGLCNTMGNINASNNCLRNEYAKHLSYIKSCDSGTTFGNCWNKITDCHYMNGDITGWGEGGGLILSNGTFMFVGVGSPDSSCQTPLPWANNINNVCGMIMVDVNGYKKPNIVGKDIFSIWIRPNQLKPFGTTEDTTSDEHWDSWKYSSLNLYN